MLQAVSLFLWFFPLFTDRPIPKTPPLRTGIPLFLFLRVHPLSLAGRNSFFSERFRPFRVFHCFPPCNPPPFFRSPCRKSLPVLRIHFLHSASLSLLVPVYLLRSTPCRKLVLKTPGGKLLLFTFQYLQPVLFTSVPKVGHRGSFSCSPPPRLTLIGRSILFKFQISFYYTSPGRFRVGCVYFFPSLLCELFSRGVDPPPPQDVFLFPRPVLPLTHCFFFSS